MCSVGELGFPAPLCNGSLALKTWPCMSEALDGQHRVHYLTQPSSNVGPAASSTSQKKPQL